MKLTPPIPPRSNENISFHVGDYSFGFNGKELDSDLSFVDYGFRNYNSKLGRFIQVDPLHKKYPYWSNYHFAGNMVIIATDLDGAEPDIKIESYPPPVRKPTWDWILESNAKAYYYKVHQNGEEWHVCKYVYQDMRESWFYWSSPSNPHDPQGKWIGNGWLPNGAPDLSISAGLLLTPTPELPRQDYTNFCRQMADIGRLYENGYYVLSYSTMIFCGGGMLAISLEAGVSYAAITGPASGTWVAQKVIKATISIISQDVAGDVDYVDVASDVFINEAWVNALVNAGINYSYDETTKSYLLKGNWDNWNKLFANADNNMFWSVLGSKFGGMLKPLLREGSEEVLFEVVVELPSSCSSEGCENLIDEKCKKEQ